MSESERKPYGDFKKRLGPNSVIPYLSANKKSYHLNLSRKFVWNQISIYIFMFIVLVKKRIKLKIYKKI